MTSGKFIVLKKYIYLKDWLYLLVCVLELGYFYILFYKLLYFQCTGCKKTCASDELDCYVLDDNGFIIISESLDNTGKFFGQIDGTIMDSLVQDRIYKKIAVYDYQGACVDQKNPYSDAGAHITVSDIFIFTPW